MDHLGSCLAEISWLRILERGSLTVIDRSYLVAFPSLDVDEGRIFSRRGLIRQALVGNIIDANEIFILNLS